MNYDIGVIFYSEMNNSLGEIIGKDNNKWIAKFYNSTGEYCNPYNVTYGIAPTEHVVIGKIKVLELLKSNIRVAEISLENSKKQKEVTEKYKDIHSDVTLVTKKMKNLIYELEQLQSKQIVEFSENRKKQINCILKALKRQRKRLMRLYSSVNRNSHSFNWEAEIRKRTAEYNFAKMV